MREVSVMHNFQGYFPRTFQDQSDFQDFPGPGIFKKKNQDFPGGVGTLYYYDDETYHLGTCEASRFDSNRPSDLIQFESDWPIRKFSNLIGRACSVARPDDTPVV